MSASFSPGNRGAGMFTQSILGRWARSIMALGVAAAILVAGASAYSAPPPRPSGSVSIHQVQVAFIGSGAAGGGTLYYGGRSYPFKLGGLGIGGIGISRLDATGSVYNLRRLADFEGV